MSLDDHIDAFLDGRLVLESARMELVQMVEDDPIILRGPGRIHQDETGTLSFEMTASEVINTDMIAWMNAGFRTQSGVVLGPERHYRLTFTDADGRPWRAEQIRPNGRWRYDADPVMSDELRLLRTDDPPRLDERHGLRLLFLEKVDLPPWSGPVLDLPTTLGDLEIRKDDMRLDVRLAAQTPLREDAALRIEEALRFLLAQDLSPRILISATPSVSLCEMRSPQSRMGKTALSKPLSSRHSEYFYHGWELFICYLDHVSAHGDRAFWHPITYHLHNAAAASGNSIDGWAIGVSVAVEGLANLVEIPTDPADRATIKRLRSWIAAE